MSERTVNRLLIGGIAALMVTFAFVLTAALNEHMAKEGEPAPAFEVRTDQGRTITPTAFGGKLLVVNFWGTWCAPCLEEIPSLNEFQERFAKDGVVVLGISIDDDRNAYRGFLATHQLAFQTYWQGTNKINAAYGTFKWPESYLIDRSGTVIKKIVGKENWTDSRVINYVQSLL